MKTKEEKVAKGISKHFGIKNKIIRLSELENFSAKNEVTETIPHSSEIQMKKVYGENEHKQRIVVSQEQITVERVRVFYKYQSNISYPKLVSKLIRLFYSADDEYALLRKSIKLGPDEEFEEYNTTVEYIKSKCKEHFTKE